MVTAANVEELQPIVHGVNVKLEKAGGLRGALVAIDKALAHQLKLWIGVMVGSALNSSCAAHVRPIHSLAHGHGDHTRLTD